MQVLNEIFAEMQAVAGNALRRCAFGDSETFAHANFYVRHQNAIAMNSVLGRLACLIMRMLTRI